jgi:hypothetical protein
LRTNFLDSRISNALPSRHARGRRLLPAATASTLFLWFTLLWSMASSACVFPHSLSYFNEAIGGPLHGVEHLLGSNVDWGQDLRYLARWMQATPQRRVNLAYFGLFNPADVGFEATHAWPGPSGGRNGTSVTHDQSLFLRRHLNVISANLLYGTALKARDGRAVPSYISEHVITQFRGQTPHARVGYSLVVFSAVRAAP